MFKKEKIEVGVQDDARKTKIDHDAAWKMISAFPEVVIGKGKKAVTYNPAEENKEEILKAAMGRSGNLRAPAIKLNGRLIIGFNDLMYSELG